MSLEEDLQQQSPIGLVSHNDRILQSRWAPIHASLIDLTDQQGHRAVEACSRCMLVETGLLPRAKNHPNRRDATDCWSCTRLRRALGYPTVTPMASANQGRPYSPDSDGFAAPDNVIASFGIGKPTKTVSEQEIGTLLWSQSLVYLDLKAVDD
ncbi:hypothetical protein CSOJ01_02642 [Colletotrichum sojae]|uniref:Uncharacterized protein n=1 Tax=Colletotrichum sojae TaxID=2175907 RepID=A0A8H6JQH4_9PEZI|nr:hypothetical protein CSOJ01_02642 [Colletotrichum sojae]